jgi:hypothetical protein
MALEHLLHRKFHPVINCFARTTDGRNRERPPEPSRSKGALAAPRFPKLFETVLQAWSDLESIPGDSVRACSLQHVGSGHLPGNACLARSPH